MGQSALDDCVAFVILINAGYFSLLAWLWLVRGVIVLAPATDDARSETYRWENQLPHLNPDIHDNQTQTQISWKP